MPFTSPQESPSTLSLPVVHVTSDPPCSLPLLPISLLSPCTVSEQVCALADSPAFPRTRTLQQSLSSPPTNKKTEAGTLVTPRQSFKKKQNKKKNNQKELAPNCQAPEVPNPTAPPKLHAERTDAEDEGFITVILKKQKGKTSTNALNKS